MRPSFFSGAHCVAIRLLIPWFCAVLTLWAFAPGLGGTFLFDDFVNLSALGEFRPTSNLKSFLLYLSSAPGDPLGRPISLLSFLLDGQEWPTSPTPFLRTNLLLHLVNGQLLMLLLMHLARAGGEPRGQEVPPALLGASLWMLHPLFLSTTLYVVQRECMLAATWVLLGGLAWLRGRRLAGLGRRGAAIPWLAAGSLAATALAALSKANGALLPMLLLVAEVTVLPPLPGADANWFRRARFALLGLPTAALFAAVMGMAPGAIESASEFRPWSIGQRVLTEPRVILDYLRVLFLPDAYGQSIFHDDFVPSTALLHPWQTLPALAGLCALIAVAWRRRRKNPVASFAFLFFISGHLMEGSIIPLELYFEHRNYLPAMPLFWPLAQWLFAPGALRAARICTSYVLVLWLAVLTHGGARLWSEPLQLGLHWARAHPLSARAQAYAAQLEMQSGAPDRARDRMLGALQQNPTQAQLAYNLVNAECALGGVSPSSIRTLRAAIAADRSAAALNFTWIAGAIGQVATTPCPGLDLDTIEGLAKTIRENPAFRDAPGRVQDTLHLLGRIALARGAPREALEYFRQAFFTLPRPETVLQQTALLASAGHPDLGLCHLNDFSPPPERRGIWRSMHDVHAWLLQRFHYWESEIKQLREALAQDVSGGADAMHPPCTSHP